MAKIDPHKLVEALHGKIDSKSDMMFVTNSMSGQVSTRKIGKRNTDVHPVTEREIETHLKMKKAIFAYHEMKKDVELHQQFMDAYHEAIREGYQKDMYRYFLHLWMDEGKNSVTLKIAKSKSSEETYVKGMQRCQTIEEANRLLVDFVEKLGYKHLAQAYKEIRKKK